MTNPQLRIRCAEAMGWRDINNAGACVYGIAPGCIYPDHPVPAYDTDANAALLLVARLKEQGWKVELENYLNGMWECAVFKLGTIPKYYASEESLPLAICLAFIKATQGETKL